MPGVTLFCILVQSETNRSGVVTTPLRKTRVNPKQRIARCVYTLRKVFEVMLNAIVQKNAHTLFSCILSFVSSDWLQHAQSVSPKLIAIFWLVFLTTSSNGL